MCGRCGMGTRGMAGRLGRQFQGSRPLSASCSAGAGNSGSSVVVKRWGPARFSLTALRYSGGRCLRQGACPQSKGRPWRLTCTNAGTQEDAGGRRHSACLRKDWTPAPTPFSCLMCSASLTAFRFTCSRHGGVEDATGQAAGRACKGSRAGCLVMGVLRVAVFTSARAMYFSAWESLFFDRLSMGMGLGPTPARLTACTHTPDTASCN